MTGTGAVTGGKRTEATTETETAATITDLETTRATIGATTGETTRETMGARTGMEGTGTAGWTGGAETAAAMNARGEAPPMQWLRT
jgi:hypothetical protein